MQNVRRSSIWFQLAFFPHLQYQRERGFGQSILSFFDPSDRHGETFDIPNQVSLCLLFWRVLLSPATILFQLVKVLLVGSVFVAVPFGIWKIAGLALGFFWKSLGHISDLVALMIPVHLGALGVLIVGVVALVPTLWLFGSVPGNQFVELTLARVDAHKKKVCPILNVV